MAISSLTTKVSADKLAVVVVGRRLLVGSIIILPTFLLARKSAAASFFRLCILVVICKEWLPRVQTLCVCKQIWSLPYTVFVFLVS